MLTRNLFFLFSISLFAIASTILDIFNYNPFNSNSLILANFYISFCVALTGILSFILYYSKIKMSKSKAIFSFFWPSIRQALLVSISLTLLLLLKGLKLLDWWVGIPLVIAVVLLELFFQTTSNSIKMSQKGLKQ